MTDKTAKSFTIGLLASLGLAIRLTELALLRFGSIVTINYPRGYDPAIELILNFLVISSLASTPVVALTFINWVRDFRRS